MPLKSDFAILDVKHGRKSLAKHFDKHPDAERIPVTITGYIDGIFGNDDGRSTEFSVHVESVQADQ